MTGISVLLLYVSRRLSIRNREPEAAFEQPLFLRLPLNLPPFHFLTGVVAHLLTPDTNARSINVDLNGRVRAVFIAGHTIRLYQRIRAPLHRLTFLGQSRTRLQRLKMKRLDMDANT